jgi:hypothetical protein
VGVGADEDQIRHNFSVINTETKPAFRFYLLLEKYCTSKERELKELPCAASKAILSLVFQFSSELSSGKENKNQMRFYHGLKQTYL